MRPCGAGVAIAWWDFHTLWACLLSHFRRKIDMCLLVRMPFFLCFCSLLWRVRPSIRSRRRNRNTVVHFRGGLAKRCSFPESSRSHRIPSSAGGGGRLSFLVSHKPANCRPGNGSFMIECLHMLIRPIHIRSLQTCALDKLGPADNIRTPRVCS